MQVQGVESVVLRPLFAPLLCLYLSYGEVVGVVDTPDRSCLNGEEEKVESRLNECDGGGPL